MKFLYEDYIMKNLDECNDAYVIAKKMLNNPAIFTAFKEYEEWIQDHEAQ